MKIDEYLSERLTNDKTADAVEENYRGLMEIEGIERDPMQESYIKLNRYERRDTPMKPVKETYFTDTKGIDSYCYRCANCGNRLYTIFTAEFCEKCGQRLQREP